MTRSHEIILSFPISTQGNLHSAVPYSHTTRLPLSGFSFISLVEGNYSKCETGKRITVCSCSLFSNPTQNAYFSLDQEQNFPVKGQTEHIVGCKGHIRVSVPTIQLCLWSTKEPQRTQTRWT